jgi:uncharacterized protein YecE (DUF72 family)
MIRHGRRQSLPGRRMAVEDMAVKDGKIRVGIGGWNYEPWRGVFYPKGLAQTKELGYAASHLTSIEINSTFYGSQKPESFRKWASTVPDGFVFAVKGPRFATNRRVLAEAGDSIKRFIDSGVLELADRLGPMLWQFAPTKKFDAEDFAKFLKLLPAKAGGRSLRHVVEVRHPSFRTPQFVALARDFGVPIVFTDHATYPSFADATGDFIYARLQRGEDSIPTAYPAKELDAWAGRLRTWAQGKDPADLPRVEPAHDPQKSSTRDGFARDVFAHVIHEGKIRAPAAAMALIERLKD